MKIRNALRAMIPAAFALTLCTGANAAEPGSIEGIESELKHFGHVVNTDTMRVARKMCAMVAHGAYTAKGLTNIQYLETHADCAKGNLHKAFKALGGDLLDDAHVASTEIKEGVSRHISHWEKDAMQLYHKVR